MQSLSCSDHFILPFFYTLLMNSSWRMLVFWTRIDFSSILVRHCVGRHNWRSNHILAFFCKAWRLGRVTLYREFELELILFVGHSVFYIFWCITSCLSWHGSRAPVYYVKIWLDGLHSKQDNYFLLLIRLPIPTKLSKASKWGGVEGDFVTCVFYKPNKEWKRAIKNHRTTHSGCICQHC